MSSNFSLDLSEQFTKAASLTLKDNKIDLLSLGYDNTVPNYYTNLIDQTANAQAQIISKLQKDLNITKTEVNVVIPDSLTYSQLLLMPDLSEEELVNSIRLQADDLVPLPINDVYIDLEVITKLQNGKLLIVFIAAQKKIVDHVSRTLELANLEGDSLENELCAVGRFLSEVHTFIREPSLVVNFGYGGSSIYVVNPPFPYFQITRSSRIGLDIMLRDLMANGNLTRDKAIQAFSSIGLSSKGSINIYAVIYPILNEFLTELEKTILMAKEKYKASIKNIYLFNNDSQIALFHETIQNRLSLPTQTLPMSNIVIPNQITQTFSHMLNTFIPVIAANLR